MTVNRVNTVYAIRLIKTVRGETLMKMRNTMAVMLIMLIIFFGNVCFAQSAKDAVRALQKLQAKIEIGMTYPDYVSALEDTWFEIKSFLDSPEAKIKTELALEINQSMDNYRFAREYWAIYLKDPENIEVNILLGIAEGHLKRATVLLSKD
jgi:hypothetical protein